jgi:hypothetical protein
MKDELISTRVAAEILGYGCPSSVFALLGNPDKFSISEGINSKMKAAYWLRSRVIAAAEKRAKEVAQREEARKHRQIVCASCGKRFTRQRTEEVCTACQRGMRNLDPHGVKVREPIAMHRLCRHPGCQNHPPMSGLYCYDHQARHKREFEAAGRCLDDC